MGHIYLVDWSAPNYRNAGRTKVLADTKQEVIKRAKDKLGSKVKKQYLHNFDAIRITTAKR